MKRHLCALAAALGLLSVPGMALAPLDGFSVRRQPKVGQVIKLRVKANLEIQNSQAVFSGLVQDKTTKVDSDGAYTDEETQTEGSAKIGDQTMQVPTIGPYPIVHNADGSLRELGGNADVSGPDAYRMSILEVLIDPGKPLSLGDTWSMDVKPDAKTGIKAAKADYKLLAEEKIGNYDTLKIHLAVKETEGQLPASSDGVVWINKVDGTLVKAEMKWTNAPFPGAPTPMNATMSETREE